MLILILLPALLLAAVGIVTRNRDALASDLARQRRQKAPKAARKNIQLAEQAFRKNDAQAFYEALWKTLTEYFGNRLNLAAGDVSLQTVSAHLPDKAEKEAETLKMLFDRIEQMRYGITTTPENAKEEMKTLLAETNRILKQCERMKL